MMDRKESMKWLFHTKMLWKVNNSSISFGSQSPGAIESKTALKSIHINFEYILNFDFSFDFS